MISDNRLNYSTPVKSNSVLRQKDDVVVRQASPGVVRYNTNYAPSSTQVIRRSVDGNVIRQEPVVVRSSDTGVLRESARVISTTRGEPRVIAVNRIEGEPIVVRSPAPVVHKEVVVQSSPKPEKQLNLSQTIMVDDNERYKIVANGMHGYGRNNIKSRTGNPVQTYAKRTDTNIKDAVIGTKSNSSEYRNDPYCTLI